MKKLIIAGLFLFGTVWASCPSSVACPYDGEPMQSTYNCKGFGDTLACQFAHEKRVFDPNSGGSRLVRHTTWVSCPDRTSR